MRIGHQEDIAAANAGGARIAVGDQFRPRRHACHAQPGLVDPAACVVVVLKDLPGDRVDFDFDAQRLGDRIHGDIVVGRTDPAGGEQVIVAGAQGVDRLDDRGGLIADDADFPQPNALHAEPAGDLGNILVMGAARQDLVANDNQRRGKHAARG